MGQITSPGDRFRFAHMHIGDDLDLLLFQDLCRFLFAVVRRRSVGKDQELFAAVREIEVDMVRVKFRTGITQRAEDTSPVGVMAVDSRLGETGGNDGFGQDPGVGFGIRVYDMRFNQVGGAFAVRRHVHGQFFTDLHQDLCKRLIVFALFRNRGIAGRAVGQDQEGIIGGCVSVYRDHVEAVIDRLADGLLQETLVNGKVRCHVAEHGAHVGMDHAGPLGHAAYCDGHAADLRGISQLFLDGIRGHDGFGCRSSGFQTAALSCCQHVDAAADPVDGQLHADDAGGSDQYGILRDPQDLCRFRSCLPAIVQAFLAGAGVGDTGIDDDRMDRIAFADNVPVPDDRRSFDDVGRKGACHCAGKSTVDQRHICSFLIFNSGCCRRGLKSLCRCYAAFCLFHILTLTFNKSGYIFFIQYEIVVIQILTMFPADLSPESVARVVFGKGDQGDLVDPLGPEGIHAVNDHIPADAAPPQRLGDTYMVEVTLPSVTAAENGAYDPAILFRHHAGGRVPF